MYRVPRWTLLTVLSAALVVALTLAWQARSPPIPRIGFVSPTAAGVRDAAFRQGLRELGYVEGRNIAIAMRFADGRAERVPALVDELVGSNVDVLVVGASIGAAAAKKATATVPVVFAGSSDPGGAGLVANLGRPEGNLTGTALSYGDGVAGKWPQLLREAAPGIDRVAVLWSSRSAAAEGFIREVEAAARSQGMALVLHHAADAVELDAALAAIAVGRAQGLIVMPSPFAVSQADTLVAFAAERGLPAVYFSESFAEAGGLMSYGPSIDDAYRRAASYVDRILKGAKPRDLPVEQPTKFELVINARAARALEIEIPAAMRVRADRIVD